MLKSCASSADRGLDYNAGEVTFTSLFPITSEMRINIEYQFSDRNYSRLVTHFGAEHKRDDWSIGTQVYSENDLKNQPLQQNLSAEQAQILAQAGDEQSLMVAPSASAALAMFPWIRLSPSTTHSGPSSAKCSASRKASAIPPSPCW